MIPHRIVAATFMPLLVWSSAAASADLHPRLDKAIADAVPRLVEARHTIHHNPELGYEEVETSKLVADTLRALGIEVKTGVAHTGIVGILRGGRPGPVVAMRADMDALPVTEDTDLPFKSTKRQKYLGQDVGVAHACGHDVHTTSLLGAATALAAIRAELPGTVVFLFQPDEEGPPPGEVTGALKMVQAGVLKDPRPQVIFGIHSFAELADGVVGEVGSLGFTSGPAYAAVDQFLITLRGKQSHGAYPHLGIDPIVMASEAVLALQTIRSRTLNTFDPAVVTIGMFHGGERFNIVPGEVHLEGTVRTYKPEVRELVKRRMEEILDGIARSAGGSFELDYRGIAPATINDPKVAAWARGSLERAVGKAKVVDSPPTMGGEDFSYFSQEVPGFYFRLGTVAPGTRSGGLHTPDFRADDTAIAVGAKALAYLALDYLTAPPR